MCAGSVPTDGDALPHMRAHLADLVIKCKPIANADHVIVLDVPPQPRFD